MWSGSTQLLDGSGEIEAFEKTVRNAGFYPARMTAEEDEAVRTLGFKGLKLMPSVYGYPIESAVVDPVMRKAAELRIPVTIHSGGIHCMPAEIAASTIS